MKEKTLEYYLNLAEKCNYIKYAISEFERANWISKKMMVSIFLMR